MLLFLRFSLNAKYIAPPVKGDCFGGRVYSDHRLCPSKEKACVASAEEGRTNKEHINLAYLILSLIHTREMLSCIILVQPH